MLIFCYKIVPFFASEFEDKTYINNCHHLSCEPKFVKTLSEFISSLCVAECGGGGGWVSLWPFSTTTRWDLAAGCVCLEVCMFVLKPQSPLNTTPAWLRPPSSTYMCLPLCVCVCSRAPVLPVSNHCSSPPPHVDDASLSASRAQACVSSAGLKITYQVVCRSSLLQPCGMF